jgi:hypothetical protein
MIRSSIYVCMCLHIFMYMYILCCFVYACVCVCVCVCVCACIFFSFCGDGDSVFCTWVGKRASSIDTDWSMQFKFISRRILIHPLIDLLHPAYHAMVRNSFWRIPQTDLSCRGSGGVDAALLAVGLSNTVGNRPFTLSAHLHPRGEGNCAPVHAE